ncbi:MAG TPA: DUF4350 domain-containing protein [Mycobacteriales bacterium]|nr:DUF4350 domain-containing protein [Mycobacteriales bacterium]
MTEAQPVAADLGAWLRRLRGPAAFVAIGLTLVALLAIAGRADNATSLDPRNPSPGGTRALAALLADRGDTVTVVDRVDDLSTAPDNTVVISNPRAVTDASLHAVAASRSTIVVVAPDDRVLSALGVAARFSDVARSAAAVEPECGLPAATVAGAARISGFLYRAGTPDTVACYPAEGGAALVETTRPSGGRTTVLGSAGVLTNAHLATEGDAALALGLLDNPTIQWASQTLQAASGPKSEQGLFNLLPPRVLWATLQLFIAVVVLALWRARRLGPLVAEPMPVVVRAAETVEGSGRLLHAARARAGAAATLRAATIDRLTRLLRIPAEAGPDAVTGAVGRHTNQPPASIHGLLYGGAPSDDETLVRLAGQLSSLETNARSNARLGGPR